ncbi:hypothetical protein [Brevundimonas sp. NIBR11]|uniref:hypothetical protein n=1 Tax=Brevundimonas sp. NIBR11 TaxID=3015999 RepID=UPI0022F0A909|nr:hypothetical protein [Brevundimonas sp. NIBR11]WGM31915.1 hypothetical protein KKHFBJBL_02166 [Brevundimonas sp. NIBR11]
MIAARRGRVFRVGVVSEAVTKAGDPVWPTLTLILTLPMFGGLFFYVVDAPPLYLLAKAWPVVTAPLTLYAAWRLNPPHHPFVLAACAWLLGVTPFVSVIQLGNDVFGALTSTVKIWPLTGALGLAAVLSLIRPTARDLTRVVVVLAILTFGFLVGAWLFAPDVLFQQGIEDTKVFLNDAERGRRINAPMMFGILALFLINRSFWRRPALWKAVLIGLGVVALVLAYKQRAQIGGTVVGLGLGALLSLRRWQGPAMMMTAAVVIAAAIPVTLCLGQGAVDSLGGSLSMRQIEAEHALAFLNDQPWRWIMGVGSATRVGNVTLGDIVGTPFFFPSDLGWLGVVFEYGAIGAALMLALHLVAIRMAWRAAQSGEVISAAVFDYALFLLIVSPVVSVVLSPGELATVLALSWWLIRTPQVPSGVASRSEP